MGKARDLTGQRFGRLVAQAKTGATQHRHSLWECLCDCGVETIVLGINLTNGSTASCGCLQREVAAALGRKSATHGMKGTATYRIWNGIRFRCHNEASKDWANYGGRGISVCDRWRSSFTNFLADMGECPPGMSIDRYPDNDGNYEPGNCRWATRVEQANNRRTTHAITHNGETLSISEWARRAHISPQLLYNRVVTGGWDMTAALAVPAGKPGAHTPKHNYWGDGE
jgi:hypothetical protein